MGEVKAVTAWLRIEQARRGVEEVYTKRLATFLAKIGRQTAAAYRAGLSEAGTLQMMEMRLGDYLPEFYRQMYEDTFRATVPLTLQIVSLQRKVDWEVLEPTDLPEYRLWINTTAAQMVRNVSDNTKQGIARIVDAGIEEQVGIDLIADRIQAAYGFSAQRAQVIARTEVVAASNSTFFHSVNRYYNVEGATKNWLATNDKRTRPTHVKAGATQKQVPFDKDFIVGGYPCRFPGDSGLPARERIQCRCVATYSVPLF